jgi:hypothetical protein
MGVKHVSYTKEGAEGECLDLTGGWRRLCIMRSFIIWYAWGDRIREDEMGGSLARMVKMRNSYTILVGKPEGKRPLCCMGLVRKERVNSRR